MNVNLRPLATADAPWLDSWLGTVASVAGYVESDSTTAASLLDRLHAERGLRCRILERDGEDVGLVVYRLQAPTRGAAIIEFVATPAAAARLGSGMRAAALIEEELLAARIKTVYAPAAAVHSIAIYFWIRLGYRPLLRSEWPCERAGVAWLRRDL